MVAAIIISVCLCECVFVVVWEISIAIVCLLLMHMFGFDSYCSITIVHRECIIVTIDCRLRFVCGEVEVWLFVICFGTLFRTILVRTRTNKSGYLTCESLEDRQYLEKAMIEWSLPGPPIQRLSLHLCVRSVRCHACTTRSVAACNDVEELPALASYLRCIYVCV